MKGFDARLLAAALFVGVHCAHAQVNRQSPVPDPAQADAAQAPTQSSDRDAADGLGGGRVTWRGYVGAEARLFGQSPAYPGQVHDVAAVLAQPEFAYESADRNYRFNATLFGRASISPHYESGDVREFVLQYRQADFSVLAGVNRVFWGATESRHLVDVVNQADLRENFAGDVKLGQLMVSASWQASWGQLEAYVLPAFRERRFPVSDDRLRFALPVSGDAEFPDGHPLDWAIRASVSRDDVDLHAYYFQGLDREPNLTPVFDGPGAPVALKPSYQKMDQFGADVQFARGGWLFKGELMYRDKPDAHYWAGVGGFEYGISRVFGSVPAAIIGRLFRCESVGPTVARASVPPMLWHMAHPPFMNTRCPEICAESTGGAAGVAAAASHARNCCLGSAMMSSAIFACWSPQNSAHWPR